MGLTYKLRDVIDLKRVEWLTTVAPDQLAPQLGAVVRELLVNEERHLTGEGLPFVKTTTVLTDTFKMILGRVFSALRENREFTVWLNMDMGSGKTHLLTLITYLLYSYEAFKEMKEYRELGLDENIAKSTALFVVDLRTPSELRTTFLPFFARSLEKAGEYEASRYILECVERGGHPEASELVRKLRRDTRLVIIVDELHHAILTYRATESERRWVKWVVDFTVHLMNYLRHHRRGFVVLVASARRDYERVLQIEDKDELSFTAENLLSQLARLEPVLETRWLSVWEAEKIILRRLGASREDILHPMLGKLVERVVKAESDIPQAQHLRSLIKALAIYTRNAIRLGHNIVSPASFSEEVLDALFPEGGDMVGRYKSIYDMIMRQIGSLEGVTPETRDVAGLAVNAVFTMSVSGKPDQLIELIKAYKLGKVALEQLPAVPENEITELLEDLGFRDPDKVSGAFHVLSGLPYVHSVRLGKTHLYFIVPVESVVTIFNRLIDDNYRQNLVNREKLVDMLVNYLQTLPRSVGEDTSVIVVGDYGGLEQATKGLNPDRMHIIAYADPELAKHLEGSLRVSPQADVDTLINEWFAKIKQKSLAEWLEEHQRHNLAVVVPVPVEDALRGVARYHAIMEAMGRVVKDYLLEYASTGSRLPEQVRRIIELELTEIHGVVKDRFIEALRQFTSAYSRALSHVYIYECNITENGLRCEASSKKVEVGYRVSENVNVSDKVYGKLVDLLERFKDDGVRSLVEELARSVKSMAGFVDSFEKARTIILGHVIGELKERGESAVSIDMNTYPYGTKILYIPPSLVAKMLGSISEEGLKESLKSSPSEEFKVAKSIEDKGFYFKIVKVEKQPTQPQSVTRPIERPVGEPAEFIKDAELKLLVEFDINTVNSIIPHINSLLRKSERGLISITARFKKEHREDVVRIVESIRRYIRHSGS